MCVSAGGTRTRSNVLLERILDRKDSLLLHQWRCIVWVELQHTASWLVGELFSVLFPSASVKTLVHKQNHPSHHRDLVPTHDQVKTSTDDWTERTMKNVTPPSSTSIQVKVRLPLIWDLFLEQLWSSLTLFSPQINELSAQTPRCCGLFRERRPQTAGDVFVKTTSSSPDAPPAPGWNSDCVDEILHLFLDSPLVKTMEPGIFQEWDWITSLLLW